MSFYHNEKIKWEAVTPDLKVTDTSNLFRLFFSAISVGFGFPEHWLGTFGHDINRACYSEDTEVLTQNGFVLHKDLQDTDEVAVYDNELDLIKYEIPKDTSTEDLKKLNLMSW